MSMLDTALKEADFPFDKINEYDPLVVVALTETIKKVYNKLKKQNKKVSRQKLMNQAVKIVYNDCQKV
jgi:hypothetical protein